MYFDFPNKFCWVTKTIFQKKQPFKRQPHKMDKNTQAIRRQKPMKCLSVFDYFVGLAIKRLT